MSERPKSPLLAFPCSHCGAAVGDLCRTASGKPTHDAHAARYRAERDYYADRDAE